MKSNFEREIKYLLSKVPKAVWKDKKIRGLLYDFLPWHEMSSIAIHSAGEDPHEPASWKYYDCAASDSSRVREEIAQYQAKHDRLLFHKFLIEAAEALLSMDFGKYGQPTTIDGFCLYKPFQLWVTDNDKTFGFNYCEYVLARRLDAIKGRTKR
jgi:hypothetical protein